MYDKRNILVIYATQAKLFGNKISKSKSYANSFLVHVLNFYNYVYRRKLNGGLGKFFCVQQNMIHILG